MSYRVLRPLLRVTNNRATLFSRPRFASSMSVKTAAKPLTAYFTPSKTANPKHQPLNLPAAAKQPQTLFTQDKMVTLQAAMPQLIPFYFVNEAFTAFICIPVLVYLASKYWLPQEVRGNVARLFISKL